MASASDIGANFSNYQGNANLGGGSFGSFQLDVRPLQDLARYTMLYNREEQARKQAEAEKAAEELAKLADYDLTTSIQKDAKVLQEKYDKVLSYARDNPGATKFGNRAQWLEFQKLKNDLANDIRGAKVRSVMNMARSKQIADEKDEKVKSFMQAELDREIDATDIRTPIKFTQEYDMTIPDFGLNKGQSLLVNKRLPNEIFQEGYEIFDASEARRKGSAFALGIDFDESTTTGKLKSEKLKSNFYVKGAEILNQAVAKASSEVNTTLSAEEQDAELKSKLSGIGIMKNIDALNKYLTDTQARIKAGEFVGNNLVVEDFAPINWKDGLSPDELAVVAQFSAWEGDSRNTKIVQTNEAIERARLAAEWERIGIAKAQLNKSSTEDLISADAVVREVQDAIKMGTPQDVIVNGKLVKQVRQIADPNLLKEFGNIDKDGNISNVPDAVVYDPQTNQLSLMFNKKDFSGNPVRDNKTGGNVIERQVALNPTQWIGQITRRKNPNKDIGGVNALVEQIYNSFDRNLIKLADGYGGKGATDTQQGDEKLTDAEYYMKYKKAKPKQ